MLYAHVYALLYAGVVAAGTCITHVPRPPGWSVALPDERNPSANAGSRKGRLAGAYKCYNARIPGHGVEPAVRTRTLVTGQN